MKSKEGIKPRGKVEIVVTRGKPIVTRGNLIDLATLGLPLGLPASSPKIYDSISIDYGEILSREIVYNIVVNQGKNQAIQALSTGFFNPICRMAMGDQGTLVSNQTVPKVPPDTTTALYHEVYRADIDTTTLTTNDSVHQVQFTKTFNSADISITAFSNQSNPIVNEIGLITANLLSDAPLPRAPVTAPATPLTDELLFSIRTFNSVPFLAASEISITINYTIFIE